MQALTDIAPNSIGAGIDPLMALAALFALILVRRLAIAPTQRPAAPG